MGLSPGMMGTSMPFRGISLRIQNISCCQKTFVSRCIGTQHPPSPSNNSGRYPYSVLRNVFQDNLQHQSKNACGIHREYPPQVNAIVQVYHLLHQIHRIPVSTHFGFERCFILCCVTTKYQDIVDPNKVQIDQRVLRLRFVKPPQIR